MESKIREYYKEILGRDADNNGLQYYLNGITNSKITLEDVRNSLLQSEEYKKMLKPSEQKTVDKLRNETKKVVNDLYHGILLRPADKEGLEYYGSLLESSKMTIHDVENSLYNSDEVQIVKSLKFLQYAPIFKTTLPDDQIEKMIRSVPHWYHYFKFGNIETMSTRTSLNYQMRIAQGIPMDLTGKSVLDIGAYDGFYSFLCESRGAKRVLAIDKEQYDGISQEKIHSIGFQTCKNILNSNVEYKKIDVYDLDKINETFDIVLFFGVYYHLENPVLAFQKILPKVNDSLFISGHVIETEEPIMYFSEYHGWWVASTQCLLDIGRRVGFKKREILDIIDIDDSIEITKNKNPKITRKIGLFEFSK